MVTSEISAEKHYLRGLVEESTNQARCFPPGTAPADISLGLPAVAEKGVFVSNYLLAGQSEDAVRAGTGVLRVGPLAAEYVGGTLTMLFNLTLAASQYPVASIIVGKGPAERNAGSGRIQEHNSFFQGSIAWEQGTVALELHRSVTKVSPHATRLPDWSRKNDVSALTMAMI